MKKSESILPIRIYDNVFNQFRFSKNFQDTKNENFLSYPANDLPSFQFRRPSEVAAIYDPSNFYLRNVCSDYQDDVLNLDNPFYKEVPKGADTFVKEQAIQFYSEAGIFPPTLGGIYDNGIDPPSGVLIDPGVEFGCDGMGNITTLPPFTTLTSNQNTDFIVPLTNTGALYHFKIIIEKLFSASGNLRIKIYDGGIFDTLLLSIDKVGIYNFDFTLINSFVTVQIFDFSGGDVFSISYLQAEINKFGLLGEKDVQLDPDYLLPYQMADGTDVILFCKNFNNTPLDVNVPKGKYYYVIECGTQYYFSEVFEIKSFLEIESYFKLSWFHSCDINNILYKQCTFINVLYLDSNLFRPQYNTDEESEENGKGEKTILFKKWRRQLTLDIYECPIFLLDALSGINLHSDIFLKEPLSQFQEEENSEYKILETTTENEELFNGYYQRVGLNMLLDELFTVSGCCNQAEQINCEPCTYNAASTCGSEDYQLIINDPPEEGDGLYKCPVEENDPPINVALDELICFEGKFLQLIKSGNIWEVNKVVPAITSVFEEDGYFKITGVGIRYWFMWFQYQKNGGAWTDTNLPVEEFYHKIVNPSEGFIFTAFISGPILAGATTLKFRGFMRSRLCDNIATAEYDYTSEL